jgi:RNA polymerase sigma factor (sigma-70 family)
MLDSAIVATVVAGDADGLAAAYDRYAAPLYAFCCALLTEPADAADAVQDTFVIAGARLAGLRDRDCLKPWLFAVARNECRRRLAARPGTAGGDEVTRDPAGFAIDLEQAELGEVVSSAIAGLTPDEREVVELSLRQDFTTGDLASALGVSSGQADALAARAARQFERSLGAVLVARTGRLDCARLDEMLEGWDGQLTVLLRERLSRHIQRCRGCAARRDRELEPALLLVVLPETAVARALRRQVLELAASGHPDAAAYRAAVLARAGAFGESGFPVPADPPAPERRVRPVAAVASVALLAVLAATGLEVSQHLGHTPRPAAAALGRHILPSQPRTVVSDPGPATRASSRARHTLVPALASAAPTVSVSLPASAPVSPPAQPTSSRTARSSPPASPSGTPTPTPTPTATGTVSVSPASVTLAVPPSGGAPSGSFTLTASGGPVSYTITVPAQYAAQLTVSPSSGSLASGASATISVTWQSSTPLQTALSVGPGGQAVSVSYQG